MFTQAGQLGKEEKMEHANFVEAYNSGKLKVHVDKNAAGFMYKDPNLLPQDIRKRQATQRFIAFVGLLGGGISFIWLPWWGALLIVLFFLASFKHIKGAASEGVLEAALQDAKVYEMAISESVLRVEPNE